MKMRSGAECAKQIPSVPDDESMPCPAGSIVKVAGARGDQLTVVPELQKGADRYANYGESAVGGGVIRTLRGFTIPWEHVFYKAFWDAQGQQPIRLLFEVFGLQGQTRQL